MVPYWVKKSPSQGMFPKKTLSRSCDEYKVDWGKTLGHGFLNISRVHIVSFMGAFVEGALHSFVCNATFFQALYFPFFSFMIRTLSAMCNGKKKSTTMPLEVRTH